MHAIRYLWTELQYVNLVSMTMEWYGTPLGQGNLTLPPTREET
jgi:hypothetical protein